MTSRATEQTSVWYFVGATFIFVSPSLFFRDLNSPWLTFGTIAVGLVVMAAGFRVMARERRALLDSRAAEDSAAETRAPEDGTPGEAPRP
jgi:hypothetical protein